MHTLYRHMPRLALAMLLSVCLLLLMAGTASAHAKVYKAIPAISSTIAQAPTTVTVFTLENMNPDPKKSNLFVYAPNGDLIGQGDAQVALQDPKQMSIAIKPNGNGVYVVRWITVSAEDGDPDEGAFVFTVKPVAAAKATTPPAATTTQTTSGVAPWVPILAGVLALLVGFGAGFGLGRRRAQPAVSSMRRTIVEQQEPTDTSSRPTQRS